MRLIEIVFGTVILSLFSASLFAFSKPLMKVRAVNNSKQRILKRDIYIAESFQKICGQKKNILIEDFSQWLGFCQEEYKLKSIVVRKMPSSKNGKSLWKIQWEGLESYGISEEI